MGQPMAGPDTHLLHKILAIALIGIVAMGVLTFTGKGSSEKSYFYVGSAVIALVVVVIAIRHGALRRSEAMVERLDAGAVARLHALDPQARLGHGSSAPPIQRKNREECINEESYITLEPLVKPALQLPPGHCYEEGDLRDILRRNDKLGASEPPTAAERNCIVAFLRDKTVRDPDCVRVDAHVK